MRAVVVTKHARRAVGNQPSGSHGQIAKPIDQKRYSVGSGRAEEHLIFVGLMRPCVLGLLLVGNAGSGAHERRVTGLLLWSWAPVLALATGWTLFDLVAIAW